MPVSRRRVADAHVRNWEGIFLDAIAGGASVREAARRAKVSDDTPGKRRREQPDGAFARAWKEAAEIGTDAVEWELARRAYHGTLKPVWYKGMRCGTVREYSDTLLMFLLKARKPHVYRDQSKGEAANVSLSVNVQAAAVVRALGQQDQPADLSTPQRACLEPSEALPAQPSSPPIEIFDPCW